MGISGPEYFSITVILSGMFHTGTADRAGPPDRTGSEGDRKLPGFLGKPDHLIDPVRICLMAVPENAGTVDLPFQQIILPGPVEKDLVQTGFPPGYPIVGFGKTQTGLPETAPDLFMDLFHAAGVIFTEPKIRRGKLRCRINDKGIVKAEEGFPVRIIKYIGIHIIKPDLPGLLLAEEGIFPGLLNTAEYYLAAGNLSAGSLQGKTGLHFIFSPA
jgi:hypothetical protein